MGLLSSGGLCHRRQIVFFDPTDNVIGTDNFIAFSDIKGAGVAFVQASADKL
jgi:hypothetical protein